MARWILHKTVDGQWALRFIASNGEILVWSESYTRREDAVRAYKTVRRASVWAWFRPLTEDAR